MPNDYFESSTSHVTDGTRAKAADINNALDALETGLDKLPSEAHTKRGTINYVVATGSADDYAVTLPYAPTTYTDGMEVVFKAPAANTGASIINVNSLGVKSVVRKGNTALLAGDINTSGIVVIRYNSTLSKFELQILTTTTTTIYTDILEVDWSVITSATNAATRNGYLCDTSAGIFTLTLPAAPSVGDRILIKDAGGAFALYNLTIARNGKLICGFADNLIVSENYTSLDMVYSGASYGWSF